MNSDEFATVRSAAGGEVIASGVARLYKSDGQGWVYTHLWGAATLVADKATHFIRLITLADGRVTFEQELYENFDYAGPTPFFITFEGSQAVQGLSFADPSEAAQFQSALGSVGTSDNSAPNIARGQSMPVLPTRRPTLPSTPSPSPTPSTPTPTTPPSVPPTRPPLPSMPSGSTGGSMPDLASPRTGSPSFETSPTAAAANPSFSASSPSNPTRTAPTQKASSKGAKPKGGFGAFMKRFVGGDEKEDIVLSGPTGFRHESHIGWDPSNGFEIRNIPPEWRKLFQQAGVKKSELQDGETSKFIMETIVEATMGMGLPQTASAPPPPAAPAAPPPPSFAAAPAPPPVMAAGGPPAPAPPPAMPTGGSSGGLLAGLQSAHLKKVDPTAMPDLKNMNEEQTTNLASTLQKAMAARRPQLEADDEEEEIDSDDEWN